MSSSANTQTLILTRRHIQKLVDLKKTIRAVEQAFVDYDKGEARMPPKIYLDLPEYNGDFRAMPAYIASTKSSSLKWVNAHPENHRYGLPAVMAVLILNDPRTGFPLSIMDATYMTALRTGAAGAVAARHLSDPQSSVVGLVGCGVQAESQLSMLRTVRRIQEVRVWGHQPELIRKFIRRMRIRAERMTMARDIEACVRDADIVVSTTPVRSPIIQSEWIKPGAHINAIGADAEGKQELDSRLIQQGCVVVDDWAQASHSGEINVPLKKGLITRKSIYATLGQIAAGRKRRPASAQKITVFDSTGLAIQDCAVAHLIYTTAKRRQVGRWTRLF